MSISDQQLIETMQEIGGLLFRRLTGELNIHEQIALDNWLKEQDPNSRQFFEECSDWDQVHLALSSMYDFNEKAALADIQKKILLVTQPAAPAVEIVKLRRGWRINLIAAAVLLVAAGVAVFFSLNKEKTDIATLSVEQRYHNDVSPGGDKAILELGDGKKIVLDNASNGELAKEGDTKIIKLDNGQLAYHSGLVGTAAVTYNIISTPRGGQYQVVLPDGSKVWLNALSSLRFPTNFTGNERKIELSGEAYFEVVKNSTMPFKVRITNASEIAGHESLEVNVLGTEFDVMAYPDEDRQKVTLISGAVSARSGNEQITLQPNQQGNLDKKSYVLNLIDSINVDETIAWKNGLFQFHDATIESIMRQAARWYDVEVSYDRKVNQQFSGTIPRNVNLSTLLKILEATGWVHFGIDGKKITVAP
jgi:ferric-dicitrate binding protein FerR (iron transport regulator)